MNSLALTIAKKHNNVENESEIVIFVKFLPKF